MTLDTRQFLMRAFYNKPLVCLGALYWRALVAIFVADRIVFGSSGKKSVQYLFGGLTVFTFNGKIYHVKLRGA